MNGFAWGVVVGALTLWFIIGAVAGILGRHRHKWRVIAVQDGSWAEGAFAYRGLLDRCDCARMRWRPNSPPPAWWPISDLHRLDGEHLPDAEHLEVWLNAMPRWGQRAERKAVRAELEWAKQREKTDTEDAA